MKDLEKRKRVMRRSMKLGHCICNAGQACPCSEFTTWNVCHCAGETRAAPEGPVRLTQMVKNPGCASKIDEITLKRVLSGLPETDDPRVLVGAPAGDDAGVFELDEKRALVLTVDVFCPSVDDPYTFGQIAAANSLSDVYAMGGRPLTALSIVGYPTREAPVDAMREILRGGVEKMAEAGVPVIGGHSINEGEVKAGFAVTGIIEKENLITNAAALAGDVLVLTKPLGTGIVAFAGQLGMAGEEALRAAAESMSTLNRTASELMVEMGAHAATDVTGFGLMGHLSAMARASGVGVEVVWDEVPLLPGVLEYVGSGCFPGAIERNRESSEQYAVPAEGVTREMMDILFDAQTSGGLLVALPKAAAEEFVARLRGEGATEAAVIGKVLGTGEGLVSVVTLGERQIPVIKDEGPMEQKNDHLEKAQGECCGGADPHASGPPETAAESCCSGASGEPCCPGGDATQQECCPGGSSQEPCCPGGEGRDVCCPTSAAAAGSAAAGVGATEEAWKSFMKSASAPGALDVATKQAVNVALALAVRCGPCTKTHIKKALAMGFTPEEIDELAWQATSFGGCAVKMFYNQFRPAGGD